MKTANKIIYSITITILFFVIIESALRLANFSGRPDDTRFILNPEWDYPEFFLKDHDLFWRFRSNQVIRSNFFVDGVYHINNHGLRGPAFAAKKSAGTQRIICIGNSCTFGWHVSEDEPYARQLEWTLNAGRADSTFEVINGGVTGYSSLQGLRFLREYVLDWEPDVLVISYGWNDHWAAAQGIPDKDQKLPPQWVLNIQNLLGRTYTYRCLKYLVFSIKSPPPADFSRTHPVYRVSPEDFRINMGAMIAEAAARNIDVYLLTLPIASRTGDEYAGLYEFHERYNQIIRSYADIEGVQVIDAADRFRDHSAFFDNPEIDLKHYNALGHKVIATMLADAIMHRGSTN